MKDQLRVLLVDDEPAVVETTEAILSEEFGVTTAVSGAAALEQLAHRTFDVICSDYNMPGMSGVELLARAVKDHPHVGTVLVTGYREYSARTDKGSGNFMLLLKPYDPPQLIDLIRRAGASARLRLQLRAINPSLNPKT